MASAFYDRSRDQWIADFRPLFAGGKTRKTKRIPATRIRGPDTAEQDAQAYARELDHYCRLCETGFPALDVIQRALHLGAITADQAKSLRLGEAPLSSVKDPLKPLTILQAADAHPSARRARDRGSREYARGRRDLERFVAWSGIHLIQDLTLDHVERWIAHCRGQGLRWNTRRHRLLYIRRACMMARTIGLPDVCAEMVLDKADDEQRSIPWWTLAELAKGIVHLRRDGEHQALAYLGLGAFVGLRPSELARVHVGDLADGALAIGQRKRKNRNSRRTLPIPATVDAWCRTVAGDRPADQPLFPRERRGPRAGAIAARALTDRIRDPIHRVLDRKLPLKCLRKSFGNIAAGQGLELRHIESYLGHRHSEMAQVSEESYLDLVRCSQLRPVAERIDDYLTKAMALAENGTQRRSAT